MNDENNDPTTANEPARTQESSTKGSGSRGSDRDANSPAPGLTTGDPVRREFTDKREDTSRKTDSSKSSDKGAKEGSPRTSGLPEEDAGEGHKGPRADATRAPSDNRQNSDRSNSSNTSNQQSRPNQSNQPNQPNPQKAAQPNAPAKSASDSGSVNKQSDAKPARTQDGGVAGM